VRTVNLEFRANGDWFLEVSGSNDLIIESGDLIKFRGELIEVSYVQIRSSARVSQTGKPEVFLACEDWSWVSLNSVEAHYSKTTLRRSE